MKVASACFLLAAALAYGSPSFAHEGQNHATAKTVAPAASINAKQAATRAALRDLWGEHVFWIRNYVVASAAKSPAQKQVAADQVVANAKAIAGAVGSFYGEPAGDRMLALLAGHWGAVKAHADATFAHDQKAQQAATTTMLANAKQIAAFLAAANPNLPEATLVGLLTAHGAHHIAQDGQIANGDYAGEARTWAAMRAHMFVVADALADALAKQFPGKF